jgi:hypothetical protein
MSTPITPSRPIRLALALLALALVGCRIDQPEKTISLTAPADAPSVIRHWELVHSTPSISAAALNERGTEGWAFARRGIVLHFQGGRWTPDEVATPFRGSTIISDKLSGNGGSYMNEPTVPTQLVLSADGRIGWAVNRWGDLLKLRDGRWVETAEGLLSHQLLQLREDGAEGWALSAHKTGLMVQHLVAGTWGSPELTPVLPKVGSITSMAVSPTGLAWVAQRVIPASGLAPFMFSLSGGVWRPIAVPLLPVSLDAIALRADGDEAWVVGATAIAHYDRKVWSVEHPPDLPRPKEIWFDFTRRRGWILAPPALFSFQAGGWGKVYGDLSSGGTSHLVVSGDGSLGFVMGDRGIELQLDRGRWRPFAPDDPLNGQNLTEVRIRGNGRSGALIGSEGAFELVQGTWRALPRPPAGTKAIALAADAKSGWAAANSSRLYRYGDRQWTPDESASRLTTDDLGALCLSTDGTRGWAVGRRGTVMALEDSRWHSSRPVPAAKPLLFPWFRILCSEDARTAVVGYRDSLWRLPAASPLQLGLGQELIGVGPGQTVWTTRVPSVLIRSDGLAPRQQPIDSPGPQPPFSVPPTLLTSWMKSDLSHGWAAGTEGNLYELQHDRWLRDAQFGALTHAAIYSLAMTPAEDDGWAVGEDATVLRYRPIPGASISMKALPGASLRSLQGTFDLLFPAPLRDAPTLALFNDDQPDAPQVLSSTEYRLKGGFRAYRLTFLPSAAVRAEELRGKERSLEVRAPYQHASLPVNLTYHSRPFLLIGPSPLRRAMYGAAGIVALNLLLLVGATRVPLLRTAVLNPVSANVLGVVLAKYLVTDQVIRHVRWVKLALYRDYRRRLAESPPLAAWQGRTYVAPQISLPGDLLPQTAGPPTPAWRQVFERLLAQPRGRLWLVQGPSGLGKSALLEQWLGLALELGETPLLIALRGELSPQRETALLMNQFGHLPVGDDLALDLLAGGGFVLLLDGLNEDRSPEVTREFVQRVAERNLVVLTSQFAPGWPRQLDVRPVQLEPFGPHQLEQLLDRKWVAEIIASSLLADMARLPVTAQLLAGFIRRHTALPGDRLEIYASLTEDLEDAKLVNLEEVAWRLFRANEFEFKGDAGLPKSFCDHAILSGVLTAGPENLYRFVHDTISRYMTACYLDRQDARPLADWHKKVRSGLGKAHWTDVLDFWGELHARRAVADRAVAAYERFLREAAGFDRLIFARRLYPRYDRLCTSGALASNKEFIAWSARVLAGSVADRSG